MLSVEKLTVSSDLLVSFARLLGKTLLLFNRVHWFAKKVLKGSAFSLKLVINFHETEEVYRKFFYYSKRLNYNYNFTITGQLYNFQENT